MKTSKYLWKTNTICDKKSSIDKHQNIGEAAWDSVENMSWNFPEI